MTRRRRPNLGSTGAAAIPERSFNVPDHARDSHDCTAELRYRYPGINGDTEIAHLLHFQLPSIGSSIPSRPSRPSAPIPRFLSITNLPGSVGQRRSWLLAVTPQTDAIRVVISGYWLGMTTFVLTGFAVATHLSRLSLAIANTVCHAHSNYYYVPINAWLTHSLQTPLDAGNKSVVLRMLSYNVGYDMP